MLVLWEVFGHFFAINNEYVGLSEPWEHHSYCLCHVASNFNTKCKSKQLKDLMFKGGNQHQRPCKVHERIETIELECLEYFEDIDLKKWTHNHMIMGIDMGEWQTMQLNAWMVFLKEIECYHNFFD